MPNVDYTPHENLNPLIWDGEELRKEVRLALMKIALEFYKFLKVETKIEDVVVSGSQANFNYTEKSDLDLHLIVDYGQVSCDYPVDEFFDTKRKLWKEEHDITVHGIPVELYVEDQAKPAVSSVYSIIKDQWIKFPEREIKPIDSNKIESSAKKWARLIDIAVDKKNLSIARKIKDMLRAYRQTGLAQGGEFSTPNLVYKTLRNQGYIQKIMETISHLQDAKLSI